MEKWINCSSCGEEYKSTVRFCPKCGEKNNYVKENVAEDVSKENLLGKSDLQSDVNSEKDAVVEEMNVNTEADSTSEQEGITATSVATSIIIGILLGIAFGDAVAVYAIIFCLLQYAPNKGKILQIVEAVMGLIAGGIIFEEFNVELIGDVIILIWLKVLILEVIMHIVTKINDDKYKSKKFDFLATVIEGLILIAIMSNGFTSVKEIHSVKKAYLTAYSNRVSIEDAFDNFFENPEWTYFVDENENGVVVFSGKAYVHDVKTDIDIQFWIDEKNDSFKAEAITFNDVPQLDFYISMILSEVYENYN